MLYIALYIFFCIKALYIFLLLLTKNRKWDRNIIANIFVKPQTPNIRFSLASELSPRNKYKISFPKILKMIQYVTILVFKKYNLKLN